MPRNIVISMYPDALEKTHRVPPVHFNRLLYDREIVPDTNLSAFVLPAALVHNVLPASQASDATPVHNVPPTSQPSGATPVHNVTLASNQSKQPSQYSLWTQESQPPTTPPKVQESDMRDDICTEYVMRNLQELGEKRGEVMFILSQFNFGSYLSNTSNASDAQLPRTSDLPRTYRRGDVDVLIIHRHYGILVGELKVVGMIQADLNQSQAEVDSNVAKRVGKAVRQLDKSETVVKHLVSDIASFLSVKKTLFLPYVTSTQLQRVLDADPQLKEKVCRSLDARSTADAVRLCCCSDQLSDPATCDVNPANLSPLTTWWQHRMGCNVDTKLTDDLYLDIVTRFAGPATPVKVHCTVGPRVEVRTEGEAVAELGERLAYLVLTFQQLDLMHRSLPLVFLTGPPGTGKTILLVLQGLTWARRGHDVQVVSSYPASLAASVMIQHQLQMTLRDDPSAFPTPGTVQLHQYNFDVESDVDRAVSDLLSAVKGDTLCILMDEAKSLASPHGLHRLVKELTGQVTHLYLWMASIWHPDKPPELQAEALTTPLRSAPVVLRMVGPGVEAWRDYVHPYSLSGLPAPGDGLNVVWLAHRGNAHTDQWPLNCAQCGRDVADQLHRLSVGTVDFGTNSPVPLTYRDAFVLTGDETLHDDVKDEEGNMTSPASGIVKGLRDVSVPVCVLECRDRVGDVARWESRVADVAVAQTDQVTIAYYRSVQGLERRVVVWLTSRWDDWEDVDAVHKLLGMSRCTTQLIIVEPAPDGSQTSKQQDPQQPPVERRKHRR